MWRTGEGLDTVKVPDQLSESPPSSTTEASIRITPLLSGGTSIRTSPAWLMVYASVFEPSMRISNWMASRSSSETISVTVMPWPA